MGSLISTDPPQGHLITERQNLAGDLLPVTGTLLQKFTPVSLYITFTVETEMTNSWLQAVQVDELQGKMFQSTVPGRGSNSRIDDSCHISHKLSSLSSARADKSNNTKNKIEQNKIVAHCSSSGTSIICYTRGRMLHPKHEIIVLSEHHCKRLKIPLCCVEHEKAPGWTEDGIGEFMSWYLPLPCSWKKNRTGHLFSQFIKWYLRWNATSNVFNFL